MLNLSLPKFSGTDVLYILQAEARTWNIPIVIVSGTEREVKELKKYNVMADAYLLEHEVTFAYGRGHQAKPASAVRLRARFGRS